MGSFDVAHTSDDLRRFDAVTMVGRLVHWLSPLTLSLVCTAVSGIVREAPLSAQIEPASRPSGQEAVPPIAPIAPDRPDVTNGTNIVEEGLLQVEVGAQHTRMGTLQSVGTPVTIRIGLFEWLEVRAGTDGFLHQTDGGSSISGAGNVQLGAKIRLFADPGGVPVLSILPTVSLPVASASKGLGTGDTDISLVCLTGADLDGLRISTSTTGSAGLVPARAALHFTASGLRIAQSRPHRTIEPLPRGFLVLATGSRRRTRCLCRRRIHLRVHCTDGRRWWRRRRLDTRRARFLGVRRDLGDRRRRPGRSWVIARQRKAARLQSRARH